MVNDGGITFHRPVNGQIRAIAGIRDFSVFQYSQGSLDSLRCSSASFQEFHAHFSSSSVKRSQVSLDNLNLQTFRSETGGRN